MKHSSTISWTHPKSELCFSPVIPVVLKTESYRMPGVIIIYMIWSSWGEELETILVYCLVSDVLCLMSGVFYVWCLVSYVWCVQLREQLEAAAGWSQVGNFRGKPQHQLVTTEQVLETLTGPTHWQQDITLDWSRILTENYRDWVKSGKVDW